MFDRDYLLTVKFDSTMVEIKPPLRLVFDCLKTLDKSLNKCTVGIYNLKESTRTKLVRDEDEKKLIKFELKVGHKGTLKDVFMGQVLIGEGVREGVNYITKLEALDGGFDLQNTVVAKTVKGKGAALEQLLAGSQTRLGKVTQQSQLTRPRVMVGNMIALIDDVVEDGQQWYIDNGQLHIIKAGEVVGGFIPVMAAESGLTGTPTREKSIIEFTSLINPSIHLGRLVELKSITAPHLNGRHKVQQIQYKGDTDGSDWSMTVQCKAGAYGIVS